MSLITKTDNSLGAFFIRVFLGVVIFPHGAQKVLGWFGGGGFQGTMEGMTGMGLPGFVVILVMLVEFIGSILLIIGLWGRLAAIAMFCLFIGIIPIGQHWDTGFFMNWSGEQPGEGFEYHLLVLGMSLGIISMGSGSFSVDKALAK